MMKLSRGQVAVVTGGGTGIGLALAEAFAARGMNLVLVDLDREALDRAQERIRDLGAAAVGVVADVSDPAAMGQVRERTIEAFGRVDVLCNNAGLFTGVKPLWQHDLATWRRLVEVNYWGVVHGITELLPVFMEQRTGHIVTTASMSGLSTVPGLVDYVCSKHAVVALSEVLRADLDQAGFGDIGVTLLCPSLVRTPMGERALGLFGASGSEQEAAQREAGKGPDLSAMLTVEAIAAVALEGIEADRLYVLPTPGARQRFDARIRRLEAAFDAYPVTRGA